MFEHRLASLLGLTIEELLALPERELRRWALYWNAEPWGPMRDNMHTAMMISELLRPHMKDFKAADPQRFMFENPEDVKEREAIAAQARFEALSRAQARKKLNG